MQVYLVGGAVRDRLLGDPINDRDWVVVGARPEELADRGYKAVGKDFPVFLHPSTGEEYALARTERKTGRGYHGFAVDASPEVTLEEDLERRDLTINAMAEDEAGRLVDPFGGRADLEGRILRHVSPAFAEDPVRVLRLARFAARYAHRGFRVAEETLVLVRDMVASGEVDHLVPERVWQELERALGERSPQTFISVLRAGGALARVLPEVDALFGVPQPPEYHPEVDTGEHLLLCLQAAAALEADREAVFAVLTHDLGKALTPEAEWPAHHGHETRGLKPLGELCERLRAPKRYRQLAERVCRDHLNCHRALELRASTVLKMIEGAYGLRQPDRFESFLLACQADARGRPGREDHPYPQAEFLRHARDKAAAVDVKPLQEQGLEGEHLGQALRQARIRAIKTLRL